jgi:predicted RNase H-like HicB family nuclease
MLIQYINAAMHKAAYKILEDDGSFFGEIPGFQWLWANATTLEACRDELQERLEDWLVVRIRLNHELPIIDEIDFNARLAWDEIA